VDALLTGQSASTSRQTEIIAQNLLVLAVGDDTGGETGSGDVRGAHGGSVTLAVSIEQGQRLILATTQGRMSLLLRNPDDVRMLEGAPEARAEETFAAGKADKAPAPAAPLSLAAAIALRDQAAADVAAKAPAVVDPKPSARRTSRQ